MKAILTTPLNLIKNKFKVELEYTSDIRRYKLRNPSKYIFNIAEFLIAVNREDVLQRHFDNSYPDDVIQFEEYAFTSGQWGVTRPRYFNTSKFTNLDQEIKIILAQSSSNEDLWNSIKYKKIDWRNQKIFEFIQVSEIEY